MPQSSVACTCGAATEAVPVPNQAEEAEEVARRIKAARATPKGQKKDYGGEMPKAYDPKYVEAATCACSNRLCMSQQSPLGSSLVAYECFRPGARILPACMSTYWCSMRV